MISETWAFLASVSFETWYWLAAVSVMSAFAAIVYSEGKLEAKSLIVTTVVAFVPVINMAAVVLLIVGFIISILESDEDVIIWRRPDKEKQR